MRIILLLAESDRPSRLAELTSIPYAEIFSPSLLTPSLPQPVKLPG